MPIAEADTMAAVRAQALAEHNQKTVDLVARSWERRNRQFIVLRWLFARAARLSPMSETDMRRRMMPKHE